MSPLAAASIGFSLLGGLSKYKAAKSAAWQAARESAQQAAFHNIQGDNLLERAYDEARALRVQALAVQGTQVAQIAHSGAVIGEGTAAAVVARTESLANRDILTAIYSGIEQRWSERTQGSLLTSAGLNKAKAYMAQGKADFVSSIGKAITTGI